ncbi:MAG: hypothetical protein PHG02_06960 [Oscillospiraceae bacterium]|nr:hypothetical protein [Oscillospiraceae bacterium]
METWIILSVLLAVHTVICITTYVLIRVGALRVPGYVMVIVMTIPVWGIAALISVEITMRRNKTGSKQIELEPLRLTDQRYRRLEIDDDSNQAITVPLEEAILMNDAATRRNLMLGILHKNPAEYVDMLQRASTSTDVELTHYATTAMMEVQADYEKEIQKCQQAAIAAPENQAVLEDYYEAVRTYVNSNLINGQILAIQRKRLASIILKMKRLGADGKGLWLTEIENYLALKEYEISYQLLYQANQKWPADENVLMLFVKYYSATRDTEMLQSLVTQIKNSDIYLSRTGREWLEFWNRGIDNI